MLIRSVSGEKVQENIISTYARDFHHQRFEKTTLIFSMQKRRKDISRIGTKELGSSPVQGVPSTDVAVPDLSHDLQLKGADSGDESPLVPDRPFPRRSGRIEAASGETCSLRREGDVVYLTVTS
ncbi:hypothetical protein TNCV_4889741 [Trichonephila clavipes]|nr:hypothetical protein TNCV_4889741 [Trichonephila clavipes]